MKPIARSENSIIAGAYRLQQISVVRMLFAGVLMPLGFAPFHLPGLALLSIALFYGELLVSNSLKSAFFSGLFYGVGFFGVGVSWVAISIHDYGLLNYFLSGMITLLFVLYLAMFPAITALIFKFLYPKNKIIFSSLLFSALWILSEYTRATLITGFPWLMIGVSQIDTPLKHIAPIFGIYGTGMLACFAATLLTNSFKSTNAKRRLYLIAFILLLLAPLGLKNIAWTSTTKSPISVAIIQSNLSMRDKWDESLLWNLLKYYQNTTQKLLGTQLIVMPESAIPLPSNYVNSYLEDIHEAAKKANSAVILGLLHPSNPEETHFLNSMMAFGTGSGQYAKRHLVPFGEYIPKAFKTLNQWLALPEPNLSSGQVQQPLIRIDGHPVASLICYEIAYQQLLRTQLPLAEWIISLSDNGWFGRSLASYQQLQMAQMLSLEAGRYQVLSNNDGLSSVINTQGNIVASLPPFSAGILQSTLYPATGETPWIYWGDKPELFGISLILLLAFLFKIKITIAAKLKRRYS